MFNDSRNNPKGQPWPVLAIGNFDGIHRGHRAIFEKVIGMAQEKNGTPIVLTFNPHPAKVLRPKNDSRLLTPLEDKFKRIASHGIGRIICEPFTSELADLPAEIFVQKILVNSLEARAVWVGSRFHFGKNRCGNVDMLKELGNCHGFSVHIMEPVEAEGEIISSTRVRVIIESGDVETASKLLGRPYSIQGTVTKGRQVGNALGFPTANIDFGAYVIPAKGVYASKVKILGAEYSGIVNVGVNPTFDRKQLCIEAHLFDFDHDVYGESAEVFFIRRIRNEVSFSSAEALVHQIRKDIQKALTILSESSI